MTTWQITAQVETHTQDMAGNDLHGSRQVPTFWLPEFLGLTDERVAIAVAHNVLNSSGLIPDTDIHITCEAVNPAEIRIDHCGGDMPHMPHNIGGPFYCTGTTLEDAANADRAAEIAEAAELGKQAGESAATWVFDGNTPDSSYLLILRQLNTGDPALEIYPPNLSGEWSGDPTPQTLARELGIDEEDTETIDAAAEAWCNAADAAYWPAVEKAARDHLAGVAEVLAAEDDPTFTDAAKLDAIRDALNPQN